MHRTISSPLQPFVNIDVKSNSYTNSLCTKITEESINSLGLLRKNRILELGHGLCNHLPFLMKQAFELKYFGMETSEKMVKAASKLNKKYIKDCNALFQIYDGYNVPYVHRIFDRVLTINTIYNYKDPIEYFNELYRCLKHGGTCVVSFSDVVFLEQLKVLEDKEFYNFYDKESLTTIIESSKFDIYNIQEGSQRIKNNSGDWSDENYFIVVLRKKEKSRYIR